MKQLKIILLQVGHILNLVSVVLVPNRNYGLFCVLEQQSELILTRQFQRLLVKFEANYVSIFKQFSLKCKHDHYTILWGETFPRILHFFLVELHYQGHKETDFKHSVTQSFSHHPSECGRCDSSEVKGRYSAARE